MKPSNREIKIPAENEDENPSLTFSHLATWFASDEILNDQPSMPYGFPAAKEEDLYQTGYLPRVFLKC